MTALHPIECSDEYGLTGVANAVQLALWLNSWLNDPDSTHCIIEKVPDLLGIYAQFNPDDYRLAPHESALTV